MFTQGRVLAVGGVGTAGLVGFYSWKVEERKRLRDVAEKLRRPQLGSVDEITSDQLSPGDLVVFQRDCSALHLPQAIHCLVTKQLLRESCDHVGIVFLDPATLLPKVLEAVPWEGVQATTYTNRVARGTDTVISLLPLALPKSKSQNKSTTKTSTRSDPASGSADTTTQSTSWWRWGGSGDKKISQADDSTANSPRVVLDAAAIRERRVHDRINTFCQSAQSSQKVPTSAKDAVGLVLNAYLAAKIVEPDPKLTRVTPGNLAAGQVPLMEGIKWGDPVSVRGLG
jgi:hypothetical protein